MLDLIFRKTTGVLLLTAVLVALGVHLVLQLPIQLYPQTQRPRVRATVEHDGISAVDFSGDYGEEIETRFLAIDGVDILEVSYENDRSSFTFTFDWETDPEDARSDVESVMTSIEALLPSGLRDAGRVGFFSGENAGYLIVGITAPSMSPEELYRTLDVSVAPMMNAVDDAESVDIYPVEELEVEVVLRPEVMLAYGVTILDIESAMRSEVQTRSVGSIEEGDVSYNLRFRKGIDSVFDVGEIVVARPGSVALRLQDVADISVAYALPRRVFIMEGERGIQITATPVDGGNVREMSRQVVDVLAAAKADGILPEDTSFRTFLDPADYINRAVENVVRAAVLGAILAMVVVLLGLGEFHNTLLIGISLPTALILSFILMAVFDVSLNLISLGGVALAVGMVIDSAIVVIENIHRHRQIEGPLHSSDELRRLIIVSVSEVRGPVIASTLTSVLVFLPISFTAPLTNAILGDQARTVVFALSISLVVALTIVPLIAYLMFRPRGRVPGRTSAAPGTATASRTAAAPGTAAASQTAAAPGTMTRESALHRLSTVFMTAVREMYKALLRRLLRRRVVVVAFLAASFGVLVFSVIYLLPLIPREIISAPLSDRVVIFFGSSSITDREQIIREVIPDVDRRVDALVGEHVVTTYADVMGRFNRLFLNLTDSSVAEEVVATLQGEFVSGNAWYYNVMMWDPAQLPLPRTMDLQISVHGDDPAGAVTLLERMRDLVNGTERYGWTFTNPSTSFSDELTIVPREGVIEGFPGLTEASLLTVVDTALRGTAAIELASEDGVVEVSAGYPEDTVRGRRGIENFLIPFRRGAVPLKHFFDFRSSTGVAGIASEDGEPIFRLYGRMPPGTPAARRAEYEAEMRTLLEEELELPQGFTITFDNPQEELDAAIRSLFVALGVSVILIYLLLAFQFNSLRIPLVILVTVPLGFIGVIASLYLFDSTLSLNSMLGTILLGGIVVNNAIIMIDFYLRIRSVTTDRIEALVETAGLRFIPIMMTMLTTVFGMLPIAIGMGEGSNIVQPLGIAVSGGLVVSTAFTLFVVPGILSLMRIREAG